MGFYQMSEHGQLKYYFNERSITVDYHGQYISFNSYSTNKKKNFNKFYKALAKSPNTQYSSINDMYGLARRYNMIAVPGKRPEIVGTIAF